MLVPYSLAVQWKVGRGCCFTLNFFFLHLMADSNLVSPPRVFNHSSLSCLSSLSLAPLEQSGQDIHATMGTHFTPQPHTDSPKTFLKEVVLSWCYDIATQVPFLNQSDWVYHFVRKHQFMFDGPSTVFCPWSIVQFLECHRRSQMLCCSWLLDWLSQVYEIEWPKFRNSHDSKR